MKKSLLLVLTLISNLGFSQQVLKRISQASTYTEVEFAVFRNGTSSGNVIGTNSFDSFLSSVYGSVKLYDNQYVYEGQIALGNFTTVPPNVICNGTLLVSSSRADQIPNFSNSFNVNNPIELPVLIDTINYRELGQGTNVDVLSSKLKFAKITFPFYDPVPTNTWIVVSSREGVDLITGQVVIPSKRLGFKFDGTTWVIQTNDWLNVPFDVLEDYCNPLNKTTFRNLQSDIIIFPNPSNKFITIGNDTNPSGNFEYEVIDITGRIVSIGNSIFNENINIESLSNGNYILKINTDSNEVAFKKFIKP